MENKQRDNMFDIKLRQNVIALTHIVNIEFNRTGIIDAVFEDDRCIVRWDGDPTDYSIIHISNLLEYDLEE